MLHDHHRQTEVRWQRVDESSEGMETPPRRPNDDDLVSRHRCTLFDLPVKLLSRVEPMIARIILREPERFFGPQTQYPEGREAFVKQPMHLMLQLAIEIAQHVAT